MRAGGGRARGAGHSRRARARHRRAGRGLPARRRAAGQPRLRADGGARATDTGDLPYSLVNTLV